MTRRILIAIVLLAALIATRWTLAPKYLFYIDNINFALAMDHFEPLQHQPQPPGYPLFVALLKLLHLAIPSAKYVQLAAGAIGSLIALLAIRQLGNEMFGAPAGWLAAALLFFQPSFWLAGIGNQVRTFLAAGSIVVALFVWRSWRNPENPRWLCFAAAALGIAGGFRPELLALLFPLLLSTLLRRRGTDYPVPLQSVADLSQAQSVDRAVCPPSSHAPNPTTAFAALAILSTTTLAWFAVLLWKTGGLPGLAVLFYHQWTTSTVHTTILGGAHLTENLRTAIRATYWTGVGALAWIWAVPIIWKRLSLKPIAPQLQFLAVWLIPPFLFHAIAFIHDPDTALDSIPVVALLGAWVLTHLGRVSLIATVAMAISAAIFFASPLQQGKDASYAWVKRIGTETTTAIDEIRDISTTKSVSVITNRSLVTARQLAYYFPHLNILELDWDLHDGCSASDKMVPFPGLADVVVWLPALDGSMPPGSPFHHDKELPYTEARRFQVGTCTIDIRGLL